MELVQLRLTVSSQVIKTPDAGAGERALGGLGHARWERRYHRLGGLHDGRPFC